MSLKCTDDPMSVDSAIALDDLNVFVENECSQFCTDRVVSGSPETRTGTDFSLRDFVALKRLNIEPFQYDPNTLVLTLFSFFFTSLNVSKRRIRRISLRFTITEAYGFGLIEN